MEIKRYLILLFIISTFLGMHYSSNAQIVVNEYSCSNLTQFVDDHRITTTGLNFIMRMRRRKILGVI